MKLRGNRAQCPACREYFNSIGAFDKHRTGPANARTCLNPADIGMEQKDGWWITRPMAVRPAFLRFTSGISREIRDSEGCGKGEEKKAAFS